MNAREIAFDEQSHTYRVGGVRVPSVTQVLRPLCNFEGIPAHVLDAKANLGRRVHLACQLDDENDLVESSITDELPYLEGWRRFVRNTSAVVLKNEQMVLDHQLRYAGTLDRVMRFFDCDWLVDIKTSFTTPRSAGPQTAAYLRALPEPRPMRRAALRLRDDGTYRLDPLDGINDWSVFVAALTLHNFKESRQ